MNRNQRTTTATIMAMVFLLGSVLAIIVPPVGIALMGWVVYAAATHRIRMRRAHDRALAEHEGIYGW